MREKIELLLVAYAPRDDADAVCRGRMLDAVRTWAEPTSRAHRPGHFTASALVVTPERDSVYLVWHQKLQKWLQPGGHIEPFDVRPVDAARREVIEETGLAPLESIDVAALVDIDIHDIPATAKESAHTHYDLRFVFTASRSTLVSSAELNGRWVHIDRLGEYTDELSLHRFVNKLASQAAVKPH